ncbi:hypothetical protein JCM17844_20950 [Iodidimonas gelatinilytica]|uniref:Transporter n=1 Tax=Iodidimonas gelatinilytica TaxID=1236966 RepID=A0A5A7MTY0_9PROT|nr:transporter [Iodidimonas gelatinilytica]GEQ98458.1 hypothetical protein JCM17844_20950 [Iodidimonas gelatinilytica]
MTGILKSEPFHKSNTSISILVIGGAFLLPCTMALAQDQIQSTGEPDSSLEAADRTELQQLKQQIDRQRQQLSQQAQQLEQQRQVIEMQANRIEQVLSRQSASASPSTQTTPLEETKPSVRQQAQNQPRPAPAPATTETVGQQAEADNAAQSQTNARATEVSIFADVGGVLTPKGHFSLEPRIDYTQSGVNRFFFQGVEIVDVVLVGLFELTDADRDTVTSSLTARYGITDRWEIDAQIPYLYRNDRITNEVVGLDNRRQIRELSGNGVGDAEIGLHYQINRAGKGHPVFIANVRGKSDLGKGPFAVERDEDGLELDLPVGSGFWTVEPSLTMIHSLDPAVLFVNAGYLFNLSKSVNALIGDTLIDRVNPGDSIRAGFGLGVGLNDTLSFSLGYEHNHVFGTKTFIADTRQKTSSLEVGSFLFGLSMGLTDHIGLNLNTQLGVTDDAPDVRISLRIPFRF